MIKTIPQNVIDKVILLAKDDEYSAKQYLAKALNVKKSQRNEWYRKIMKGPEPTNRDGTVDYFAERKTAKAVYTGLTGVAESVDENVKTLEDLLKVCQVDLEIWEVEKYIINKWGVARKNDTTNITYTKGKADGQKQDDGGMTVQPLFQVKAWLKKKQAQIDMRKILEEFVESARKHSPSFKLIGGSIFKSFKPTSERLLEISIPDLHLAKLCWSKETKGEDWDIKLAPAAYKESAYELLNMARSAKPTRILLPVGNDFFNSDNMAGTTTAGTEQSQSEDSRWQKTFLVGCQLLRETIEVLATEFPVDVIIVPGNHDYERSFYLGEYLSAWFRNHTDVTVNNEPTQRKYYVFGQNLVGFTHGNEEKHDKLPMIMANEMKDAWSTTKFRFFKLGHLHGEIIKEYAGVKVCVIPSLVPRDSWHTSKGYIGNIRSAQASLYDFSDGLIATYYHNV